MVTISYRDLFDGQASDLHNVEWRLEGMIIIEWFDSWYSWWMAFWAANPTIFFASVGVAIGISVFVQRLKRRHGRR